MRPHVTEMVGKGLAAGPVHAMKTFVMVGTLVLAGWGSLLRAEDGPSASSSSPAVREEDMTFSHHGLTLAGTFRCPPSTAGTVPALVFVHGGGRLPRDFYGDLPQRLATRGLATLCFDKRGTGKSQGQFWGPFSDTAEDVLAAVAWLKGRKEVDQAQIGVLALSEGGMASVLAASRSKEITRLILVGAPATTLRRRDEMTRAALGRNLPMPEALMKSYVHIVEEIEEAEGPTDQVIAKFQKPFEEVWDRVAEVQSKGNPTVAEMLKKKFYPLIQEIIPEHRKDRVLFDPLPLFERVTCPVLAVYGALDLDPAGQLSLWAASAKRGRNTQLATVILPHQPHVPAIPPLFEALTAWWPGLRAGEEVDPLVKQAEAQVLEPAASEKALQALVRYEEVLGCLADPDQTEDTFIGRLKKIAEDGGFLEGLVGYDTRFVAETRDMFSSRDQVKTDQERIKASILLTRVMVTCGSLREFLTKSQKVFQGEAAGEFRNPSKFPGPLIAITCEYLPVGAFTLELPDAWDAVTEGQYQTLRRALLKRYTPAGRAFQIKQFNEALKKGS